MILHITTDGTWAAAVEKGSYTADSLSKEGFIHCSTPAQVVWVANQRFRGRTDLVLLHIDPVRVNADVIYENLEGGQMQFPHVYGPIPISAVIDVTLLRPAADGSFNADSA